MAYVKGKQVRAVVQAKTKKRMAELAEEGAGRFRNYWSTMTGHHADLPDEEGLWVGPDTNYGTEVKDYNKIK